MDHLQSDIESLESEKGELKEKLKALNKKTLYEAFSKASPLAGILYYSYFDPDYYLFINVVKVFKLDGLAVEAFLPV